MRLALLQNLYPEYVRRVEEDISKIRFFQGVIKHLDFDSFGWNGVWNDPLSKCGIELFELFANVKRANELWAEENGFNYSKLSREELLIKQIGKLKIEVLINTDVKVLSSTFIKRVKSETSVKRVYAHICSPYYSLPDIKEYHGIFTCLNSLKGEFERNGIPAYYVPHAFNSNLIDKLAPVNPNDRLIGVLFAGGVIKGQDFHDSREKLLLELMENNVPLKFYSELYNNNKSREIISVLAKQSIYWLIKGLRTFNISDQTIHKVPLLNRGLSWRHQPGHTVHPRIIGAALPPLYGLDLYKKFNETLISLNIHAGIAATEAANMRLFEAPGLGSALLTDHKDNLANFFEIDREIVTYKTTDEAIEKAKYLLANPKVAVDIGLSGKARVLRDHTYHNRAIILSNIIEQDLK